MIRVCAWCKKVIGEKEPFEDKSVTHGICQDCYDLINTSPICNKVKVGEIILKEGYEV